MSSDAVSMRARMLAARRGLTAAFRAEAAQQAAARLLSTPAWAQARRVLLYAAVRHELDAQTLLEAAWQSGKQVFLPRCLPTDTRMEIAVCAGPADLVPGRFGIAEPAPACPAADSSREADGPQLAVVPGLAFDRTGNRIGHGQGFYDRFLAQPLARNCLRVGYAYAFQVLDAPQTLDAHALDIPMHALCTEKEFLWI